MICKKLVKELTDLKKGLYEVGENGFQWKFITSSAILP